MPRFNPGDYTRDPKFEISTTSFNERRERKLRLTRTNRDLDPAMMAGVAVRRWLVCCCTLVIFIVIVPPGIYLASGLCVCVICFGEIAPENRRLRAIR